MDLETKAIRSDRLPESHSREWWRAKSRRLFFLCTVVLASSWDEKFKNFGILQRMLCDFLDPELNTQSKKFVSVFRGSYKTTILLGLCLYLFCWSLATGVPVSIVYNTSTKENAEAFMEDFRQTLANNIVLHWIFNEIPKSSGKYRKWTRTRVEFGCAKFRVASLEVQQVGLHSTVIINDDLVNDINAFSEVLREQIIQKWRMQKSILTRYKKHKVGMEIDCGTLYHSADLVSHIIKNVPKYHKFIIPFALPNPGVKRVDPTMKNGTLTFPEMFEWEDFEAILEEQGESIFATQYRLEINDVGSRLAQAKDIRRWVDTPKIRWRTLIIDPAGSENPKNDPSGYLVYDVDQHGNVYLVFAEMRWLTPWKMLKHGEAIRDMFHVDDAYMEQEKYSDTIQDTIDVLAPKFHFTLLPHKNKSKEQRAMRMRQWFETGRVFFGPNMEKLERMVLDWPDIKEKALIDCLGYIPDAFMIPSKYAVAQEEDDDQTDFSKEMAEALRRMDRIRSGPPMDASF